MALILLITVLDLVALWQRPAYIESTPDHSYVTYIGIWMNCMLVNKIANVLIKLDGFLENK